MTFDPVIVSLGVRWLAGWFLGGGGQTLSAAAESARDGGAEARETRVSVVIPARNEAGSLPVLLHSLETQSHRPVEVLVVDDESTDGTDAVAARAGVSVLRSAPRPPGWLGKPWACAQGAAAATGELLVFLDADTIASPDFLESLVLVVLATPGVVSVAPYHRTRRPYEMASALFNLVALMGVGALSMRRGVRVTGAFGPCIAVRARHYAAIGGHAAVSGKVLEDVALARTCQRQGLDVVNLVGADRLQYRMYPEGPGQLLEGWTRTFAEGARTTPVPRLLMIVAWMSGLIETGTVVALGLWRWPGTGPGVSWLYLMFYVLFALQLWWLLRRVGNFAAVALVHPLGAGAFLAICTRSLWMMWRGRVKWKGRTIPIRG